MTSVGYFERNGFELREGPAREPCFQVVWTDAEMHEHEGTGELARREAIHRHMSNELTSLDIAAQCVAEFPDAPWELRMELARQCWDETRHVAMLERRLRELGGVKGEFPVSVFEWAVTSALGSIEARLATQNRTFEAGAMDVVGDLIPGFRDAGDLQTTALLEAILADEIQHVRFANRWIRKLAAADGRVLMRVAAAVRFLAAVNESLRVPAGTVNPVGRVLGDAREHVPRVNVEDRRLADFSEEEVREILRQAGFRSLLDPPGKPPAAP